MMAYLAKVLRPDEQVLFQGRLHWVVYGPGLGLLAASVALLVAASLMVGADAPLMALAALLAAVLALCSLLSAAVRRATTEIAVTDRRVIYKTGWLRRRTMEMNVSKIETVDVLQGLAARAFGFGTVVIRGTGSSFEPLSRVVDPLGLRNAIVVG